MSNGPQQPQPRWLRLSPRSLVVRPIMDLVRLLPFLLGLIYLHSRGGNANYWGLAFAAFAVVTSIVRWFTTRYRLTDERVYVRHGLLNQKVLSVARDRVRTVDLSAHLPYRMLGLRRVSIGTGRNDRREGESFRLDALTLADAEASRARQAPLPDPTRPVSLRHDRPLPCHFRPGQPPPGQLVLGQLPPGQPQLARPPPAKPRSAGCILPGSGSRR